jgi:RNA polymerase sigma-32 factor
LSAGVRKSKKRPAGASEGVPEETGSSSASSDSSHDASLEAELAPETLTAEMAEDESAPGAVEVEVLPPEDEDADEPIVDVDVDTPAPVDVTSPVPAPDALPTVFRAGEGSASALTRYMAELRHHAPISREEEHRLAVEWVEEGDIEAARKLVLSNLRLVVKIAMEYRRAWTNTLDLVQEGNVGLMEAVQRYDPYLGVKLSSYAVYWIRAYILKYILDNMRSTRMGTTRAQRKLFFRLNKEKRKLEAEGYEVEPKLIAERLDVTEDDVIEMEARLSRPDMSMDAPARRDESDGATFGDTFAGPGISVEKDLGNAEMRRVFLEQVGDFADGLSEREQRILWDRLLAAEQTTLAELGKEFGVSRERVRQLEARLLQRLRAYVESNVVDFEHYATSDD